MSKSSLKGAKNSDFLHLHLWLKYSCLCSFRSTNLERLRIVYYYIFIIQFGGTEFPSDKS